MNLFEKPINKEYVREYLYDLERNGMKILRTYQMYYIKMIP